MKNINYRNIFNINYSYIVLTLICILFLILYLLLKNANKTIKIFSNVNLISGIITITISYIINILINNIFIKIISDTISSQLLFIGLINILLWLISFTYLKIKKLTTIS